MEPPLILLIGKNGQVGWELRRALAPMARLASVDYPEIDLGSSDSIHRCVKEVNPRVIINAAAYTAVDKAESEPGAAMRVNGLGPGILAEAAAKKRALLVHYSTDYIFDGNLQRPYLETDSPNPISAYGRSKLAGDEAVRAVGGAHLIFRLCWVYGLRGSNFLLTLQRLARERDRLRVVNDQFGCPTWSRLIAQATALALQQTLAAQDPLPLLGTYHLAAAGVATWHDFASAIVRLMPAAERKCTEVEPIPTSEYPLPARRPARSVLDCSKLERVFGLRLPPWNESLQQALEPDSNPQSPAPAPNL
ncbi:MAG: dTDP-4-dehydrorhamnose reductase [Verrucomicrobiota bacterium]